MQIDFTEGRLAIKLDPSGNLLNSFIDLNNLALSRFSAEERKRIGIHTCPGGDRDSTHSADVDYADLLPSLFELHAGNFYIALAGEKDRVRVLKIIRQHLKPDQRVFVGVVSPIDPRMDTPEEVRDRVLEAAQYIPLEQLGTTDDCGFSPFCDDTSTTRETAFAKIRARVLGTALAEKMIEGREGRRRTAKREPRLPRHKSRPPEPCRRHHEKCQSFRGSSLRPVPPATPRARTRATSEAGRAEPRVQTGQTLLSLSLADFTHIGGLVGLCNSCCDRSPLAF